MKNVKKLISLVLVVMLALTCVPVNAKATAVILNATSKTMSIGEKATLKVYGATSKIKWSSANKAVATVNQKGKVTAKSAGTATIKAKVSKKTLKCKVTVKERETQRTDKNTYKIGETWTVPGQWKITINSVTETDYRNEFSDQEPEAVYMIDYSYENIGYEDKNGIMDGLFIDLDMSTVVDAEGYAGFLYPGDITYYAKEIPVGAKCQAQSCYGVMNKGNFKVYFEHYDGNGKEQKAVFEIKID